MFLVYWVPTRILAGYMVEKRNNLGFQFFVVFCAEPDQNCRLSRVALYKMRLKKSVDEYSTFKLEAGFDNFWAIPGVSEDRRVRVCKYCVTCCGHWNDFGVERMHSSWRMNS